MMFLDIEMPVDEIVINNEIPVNEPERENVPLEKNDMVDTGREYETAAAMFANAQLEIKKNEPIDEELVKFFADLVQSALEENGQKKQKERSKDDNTEKQGTVLPIRSGKHGKKIIAVDDDEEHSKDDNTKKEDPVLPIRSGKHGKKIIAVDDDEEHSKDDNTKKKDPVLPIRSGKHGKKMIAVDDDEDDVVILSQSSTSSSSSSSSGSSSSSSDPPTIMNDNNVAEKYDEEHQYRPKAGSSKPKNESVDITDFCVDCEGYQCPNKAATPHHQFCKGCHEKWQMGEQPHYPHPSPIPNPIFEKRQQLVDDRIKCLQNQIRELEESLSHVKCDLCGGEPIVNEFGHCERCAQLID
ncbi:uncharacterized protein DDB_G0284459-like isoform X1 [Aphidius gifuensis]|uniref:uncharacterized protein DDB_G0284459-like isoform X1 n=1 Tax=Aphidius gifuensis TaxID=684658 RepID=UPI001CDBEBFD|nr:uncharacterized protein DDB_G0284459-like isoform X1 [Aphidius gifuensis]